MDPRSARFSCGPAASSGVALDSGEKIEADNVVSTIDLKRVAGMMPQELLTAPWRKALAWTHSGLFNVGEIKVDAALDRPPVFRGETPAFAGSLKYLMHSPEAYVTAMRTVTGGRIPAAAAHGGDSFRGRSFAMPTWKGDAVGVGVCAG